MKIIAIVGIIILVTGLVVEANTEQHETYFEFLERKHMLPAAEAKTQDGLSLRRSLRSISELIEDTNMMRDYKGQDGKRTPIPIGDILVLDAKLEARHNGKSAENITYMGIPLPNDMTPANWNWLQISVNIWFARLNTKAMAALGISFGESYVSGSREAEPHPIRSSLIPTRFQDAVAADISIYMTTLGLGEYLRLRAEAQERENGGVPDAINWDLFKERISDGDRRTLEKYEQFLEETEQLLGETPPSLDVRRTIRSDVGESHLWYTDSPPPPQGSKGETHIPDGVLEAVAADISKYRTTLALGEILLEEAETQGKEQGGDPDSTNGALSVEPISRNHSLTLEGAEQFLEQTEQLLAQVMHLMHMRRALRSLEEDITRGIPTPPPHSAGTQGQPHPEQHPRRKGLFIATPKKIRKT
jgi:hypothetical protein